MEYLILKNSELKVSRLCMGGCAMGEHGWGDVQKQELLDAVSVAIDNGINFFDTADIYGLGRSEENLATALGDRRKDVVIASKFGVRIEKGETFYDNSPKWINLALEASLKRLKTDYIDLYQVHYYDGITPWESIVETLDLLKRKGYIRSYGLSNINLSTQKELILFKNKFVSMQDEYSLACRKNEKDIKEISELLSITPMTWGSLGQGILTGKYDNNCVFNDTDRRSREIYTNFHGDKLLKNLEIVELMKPIAEKYSVSISAVAIRFILDYIKNSVVIVGAKRPSQILGNIEAISCKLNEKEISILEKFSK